MEAQEAIAIRDQLALTPDALDAELNLASGTVSAWENGSMKVPTHLAEQLRWRGAVAERNAALAASGLPECAWVESWSAEPQPRKQKARNAHLTRLIEHEKACPTCQSRSQFLTERFGPMPPAPMPLWMKGLSWFGDRLQPWPEWARPAAWVALFFGLYSLLRVLLMLPQLMRYPQQWLTAVEGLAASVSIGAIVGLAYGLFRSVRGRTRRAA